jgi:hypothetical protein
LAKIAENRDHNIDPQEMELMPPVDQHLISTFAATPLFGSSMLGSPLSSASLLNTPVPTPGNVMSTATTRTSTAAAASETERVVVVKEQPPPTPDPNEAYIKKVIKK